MKLETRRVAAFFLIPAILSMLICGCAESPSDSAQASSAAGETANSEPVQEVIGDKEEKMPVSEQKLTYTVFTSAQRTNDYISGYKDYSSIKHMEEQANVTFEFTEASFDAFDTQWSLMLASGELADILRNGVDVFAGGLLTAVEEDIILDITPYAQENMPNYYGHIYDSEDSSDIQRDLLYDGKILALFVIKEESPFDIGGSIIRGDWLEKLGLDVPYTYDEYTDVLQAFKTEYGLSMPYVLSSATQNQRSTMIQAFDTGGVILDGHRSGTHYFHNDGVVYSALNTEEYRNYLSQMNEWYELGIITSDFLNISDMTDDSARVSYALDGKAGIWYGKPSDLNTVYAEGKSSDPDFKAVAIAGPFVSEDQTETYYNEYCSLVATDMVTYVSAQCENVEFLLSLADWCYGEAGGMFCTWGVQGETWDYDNSGKFYVTDLVLNNTWGLTESSYIGFNNFSLWGYTKASNGTNYFYTQKDLDAIALWDVGNQDHAIGNLDPTIYNENYSVIVSDIDTYAIETVMKFIVGELNVDGSDWDTWCDTLDSLGLQATISAMQQAVDVWLGR